jgi:predicted MFS family arabinose efflux permease
MIGLLTLCFTLETFEWFVIVPALPGIQASLDIGLGQASLLVSLFFFGYALAHIPAGLLSAAFGAKRTLIAGMVVMSVAPGISAFVDSFAVLAVLRVVAGIGTSIVAGAVPQLLVGWARPTETRLVLGVAIGVGFTVGAGAATYAWVPVVEALGWRTATGVAGAIGLGGALLSQLLLRTPPRAATLGGGALTLAGTRHTLRSRNLWGLGLGSLGSYGLFFTIAELGPGYAADHLGFSALDAGLLAAVVTAAGLPGSVLGGLVSDRTRRYLPAIVVPGIAICLLGALVPFSSSAAIWVVAVGAGFLELFLFTPLSAAPAEYPDLAAEDFATGWGLILMLCNVGAFIDPVIYGFVATNWNPTAAWLAVATIGVLSWSGYLLVREPRTSARTDGTTVHGLRTETR